MKRENTCIETKNLLGCKFLSFMPEDYKHQKHVQTFQGIADANACKESPMRSSRLSLWLKQQKFDFSHLWRSEVQDQVLVCLLSVRVTIWLTEDYFLRTISHCRKQKAAKASLCLVRLLVEISSMNQLKQGGHQT